MGSPEAQLILFFDTALLPQSCLCRANWSEHGAMTGELLFLLFPLLFFLPSSPSSQSPLPLKQGLDHLWAHANGVLSWRQAGTQIDALSLGLWHGSSEQIPSGQSRHV